MQFRSQLSSKVTFHIMLALNCHEYNTQHLEGYLLWLYWTENSTLHFTPCQHQGVTLGPGIPVWTRIKACWQFQHPTCEFLTSLSHHVNGEAAPWSWWIHTKNPPFVPPWGHSWTQDIRNEQKMDHAFWQSDILQVQTAPEPRMHCAQGDRDLLHTYRPNVAAVR